MLRHQAVDPGGGSFIGSSLRSTARDGRNPIERKAVARVQREIAAMPASLVVQLAMWPDEIAPWARAEGTSESLVYNMLAGRKPYLRVRERLAERLEVPAAVVAHLVDAKRPLPLAKRDPAAGEAAAPPEPVDWSQPPFPRQRDGTNPIERRAVHVFEREVASMPASAVVGLALWPTTLAAWSREHRLASSLVWATLAGSPSERVRAELAARLDVTRRDLYELVAATRAQAGALRTPELSVEPSARRAEVVQEVGEVVEARPERPRPSRTHPASVIDHRRIPQGDEGATASPPAPPPPPHDEAQLSLGF